MKLPMAKLIATLLLLGFLAALREVDKVTAHIYARLDASRPPAVSVTRTSREARAVTVARATGFRTTHVFVPTAMPSRYDRLIERYSTRSAVRPELVRAVIQVESGFDPTARSRVGAMGLMQLMPQTAAELGVADPYDPEDNLRGGINYLKQLLRRYAGNEEVALAAYNAGPEAVARYGNRVPPYPETRNYVEKIRSATAEIAATPPASADGVVYKSYVIVDGWWTVVYSNISPASGRYAVTIPAL